MINMDGVVKEYRVGLMGGRVRALAGVSLEVESGASLGIVGPNGAGKSTLIRLLLGYIRPTRGTVAVDGVAPRAYVERSGIGYVPERVDIPPRWRVRGALTTYALLSDLDQVPDRVDAVLGLMGLQELADRRVGALSKGNLQRLGLAQALLGPRALLVLDEPTDGLDPEWIARVREILRGWRAEDPARTLLFASHNLDEIERIADRVVVLDDGRVREVIDLSPRSTPRAVYRLEVAEGVERAAERVRAIFPGAVEEGGDPLAFRIETVDVAELNRGLGALLVGGLLVRSLAPHRPSLEDRVRRAEEDA
jgi:ABC-type multidrug transport system ATPase subunit